MSDQPELDTSKAQAARRYDYWLDGKDNFARDRESGDLIEAEFPTIRVAVQHNRRFLRRAVAVLAGEHRVAQFLDIGAGLPTAENTHQVAQRINPKANVVYVDNDPIVLVHGRALLVPLLDDGGTTTIVEADLRDPVVLLDACAERSTLDFSEPVGLLLIAVLHFLADADDPHRIVQQLIEPLAPGSWLAWTHATDDLLAPDLAGTSAELNRKSGIPMTLRSHAQIAAFADGLQVAEPGVVPIHRWRNPDADLPPDAEISAYGGIARKP